MNLKFINNISVTAKLLFGFGIILAIMAGVTLTAVLSMSKATDDSGSIVTEQLPQLEIANEISRDVSDAASLVQLYTNSEDPALLEDARTETRAIQASLQRLGNIPGSPEERQRLAQVSRQGIDEVNRYNSLLDETERTILEFQANRRLLIERADLFGSSTNNILTSFKDELEMELESGSVIAELLLESVGRIHVINNVIERGYYVFTMTWEGIAERDPAKVREANQEFTVILEDLAKAQASTMDFFVRELVDEIIETCEAYQQTSEDVINNWLTLNQLLDQLAQAGMQLDTLANNFSTQSVREVTNNTESIQTLLLNSRNIVIFLTVIAFAIGSLTALVIVRSMTIPIREILGVVNAIADGDLRKECKIDQKDELGVLAKSLNASLKNLRSVLGETLDSSDVLAQSAMVMSDTSRTLLEKSTDMSERSTTVAAAGEQLSTNIGTMAKTADELSNSAQSVASAVEEMSSSINEVAQNCAKESEIAGQANKEAESARAVMSELGTSANEISKIVEIINNIAAQTNLLALNATIEAASAGEAGKGFAVVANEVKDLARQSAQATEQISKQIEEMQQKTHTSVHTIESITTIIEEVNNIAITIASAVEEQSVTTNEISRSLSDVSESINHLANNIQHAASGANEVSENIQEVSFSAQESVEGANNTSAASSELSELADKLRGLVSRFKV